MTKRLQKKFITVTMAILTVVLFVIYFCSVIVTTIQNSNDTYEKLRKNELVISVTKEEVVKIEETKFDKLRTFSVLIDSLGSEKKSYDSEVFSEEEIESYKQQIISSDKKTGRIGHLYFIVVSNSDETLLMGIDRTVEDNTSDGVQKIILIFLAASWLLLLIVVYLLSSFVVKPAKDALDKQKQFISDASHELKTPLAIVSADIQILQEDIKNNKWIESISDQSKRMSSLLHEMLTLTKLDEYEIPVNKTKFNLGKFVEQVSLSFETYIFERGRTLKLEVEENCEVNEDKECLKKVLETLLENAIKYSEDKSEILVKLSRENNKLILELKNKGCKIKEKDKSRIFDRFYKQDESRKKDGSFGLGLAIVKRISDLNRWKISLDCEFDNYTKFTLNFNVFEKKTNKVD